MSRRSLGARFVRLLARCTSFCYPTAFRRQHGVAFADVADRLLANERTRRAPLRAVLSTSQVILGDALSASEQRSLLAELDTIPYAPTCPHGRPVAVPVDRAEIERRFSRR